MSDNGKLKPSRYNILIDLPEGGQLAFNSASAALAEIDEKTLPQFQRLLDSPNSILSESDSALLENMKYARFVCPAGSDEVTDQKDRNELQRHSRSTLILTIAPTLACNFRCGYCFQNNSPIKMNAATAEALLKFCEQQLPGTDKLMLTWFGGEPTLCLDVVESLQTRLSELCQKHRVAEMSSSMISNGYLLDGAMAARIKAIGIDEVQVTIDGPPEIHDSRRKLANGRGTFERIVGNLEESSRILRTIVRINVDTSNAAAPLEVVDLLDQRGILSRVNIYFAPVNPAKGSCADIGGLCLGTESFAKLQAKLYRELVERGHRRIEYPQIAPGGYCGAGSDHSFVVAPNGLLFKCWEELSLDPEEAIGDVFGSQPTTNQLRNLARYQNTNPFARAMCRECDILPLCLGGCPNVANSKPIESHENCSPWKFNLREMLTLRYLCNTQQEVSG